MPKAMDFQVFSKEFVCLKVTNYIPKVNFNLLIKTHVKSSVNSIIKTNAIFLLQQRAFCQGNTSFTCISRRDHDKILQFLTPFSDQTDFN